MTSRSSRPDRSSSTRRARISLIRRPAAATTTAAKKKKTILMMKTEPMIATTSYIANASPKTSPMAERRVVSRSRRRVVPRRRLWWSTSHPHQAFACRQAINSKHHHPLPCLHHYHQRQQPRPRLPCIATNHSHHRFLSKMRSISRLRRPPSGCATKMSGCARPWRASVARAGS